MVFSPDGDTEFFDIVAGVLKGDILPPDLFIISLDDVLWMSTDWIKENGFMLKKKNEADNIMQTMQMIKYFLQIHQFKLSSYCIAKCKHQEALASTWLQIN